MTLQQHKGVKFRSKRNNVPFYARKMSTHLSPEMSLLLEKMKEQLNLQTNIITENITTAVLKQVDEKNSTNNGRKCKIENRNRQT